MRNLCNALLFNASWLAIVSLHSGWSALLVVVVHLLLHWRLFLPLRSEWAFIALVTAGGFFVDQLLFLIGLLSLPGSAVAPLWLSALWPVLASTLRHGFAALSRWPLLAVLTGGIGGLGSYRLGAYLSPVELGPLAHSDIILGLIWAVLLPLLLLLAAEDKTVSARVGHA